MPVLHITRIVNEPLLVYVAGNVLFDTSVQLAPEHSDCQPW